MRVPRELNDKRLAEIDAILKYLRQTRKDTLTMINAVQKQRRQHKARTQKRPRKS